MSIYQEVNSKLFNHLRLIKTQKFPQLIGPPITCDSSLESLSTVVTIPENLPLSDSEKSVFTKGLNFVPISKNLTNSRLSKMLKNFFAAFNLKPFSMIKRIILTPGTKPFSKIEVDSSRGPVRLFRFFINKCRHVIKKLNFNRNTKFSNLS